MAQARISSTIQLLPEVGRTSTIPRGPARTLSTIHLLLEVGRTSTSKGTGENLEHYPPPPKGDDDEKDDEPEFTSRYHITAVGAEVRNGTVSVPGPADAVGYYNWNQLQDR